MPNKQKDTARAFNHKFGFLIEFFLYKNLKRSINSEEKTKVIVLYIVEL